MVFYGGISGLYGDNGQENGLAMPASEQVPTSVWYPAQVGNHKHGSALNGNSRSLSPKSQTLNLTKLALICSDLRDSAEKKPNQGV